MREKPKTATLFLKKIYFILWQYKLPYFGFYGGPKSDIRHDCMCMKSVCTQFLFTCDSDYMMSYVWEWRSLSASVYVWAALSFVCVRCVNDVFRGGHFSEEREAGNDAASLLRCISRLYYVRAFFFPQRGADKRFCFSLCVGSFHHPDFLPQCPHTHPPVPRIHLYSLLCSGVAN